MLNPRKSMPRALMEGNKLHWRALPSRQILCSKIIKLPQIVKAIKAKIKIGLSGMVMAVF